jgi:hypothetical protein
MDKSIIEYMGQDRYVTFFFILLYLILYIISYYFKILNDVTTYSLHSIIYIVKCNKKVEGK